MADSQDLPPHYAESVMIGFIAPDGGEEISIRLARFPETGKSHVWASLATKDGAWSVADEHFTTGHQATPVGDASVVFAAHEGEQSVTITSDGRDGNAMQGRVQGLVWLRKTRFPEEGAGTIPMRVDLHFAARSTGFKSRGRWELTGRFSGDVHISGKTYTFAGLGKWHEQTGPRARFAPAFTYLNLESDKVSILAIGFKDRVAGYLAQGGELQAIKAFSIDKQGPEIRHFKLTLGDGEVVTGAATVVQRWSVPIEGKPRAGSAVLADTSLGKMVGSLNDWDPE